QILSRVENNQNISMAHNLGAVLLLAIISCVNQFHNLMFIT
uniref:Uncharacterized protein n=1 Tax=Aegilops tauschii subsp. strangulata TaxID=200361 RepID=A0A453RDV6_AEGTS